MERIRIDLIAMYGRDPHHPTRKCAHFHKVTLYNKLIELLKKGMQMNKSKEKCAPENMASLIPNVGKALTDTRQRSMFGSCKHVL